MIFKLQLVREFEKIMNGNVSDFYRTKWSEIVIKIISLGKASKAKGIKKLFETKMHKGN